MTSDELARETFVDWLARRMTAAGRGDADTIIEVEPSGKYWLGRLQSTEGVANSALGDRGERLEPCAVGFKVKLARREKARARIRASARVWLWNKTDRRWHKSDAVTAELAIDIPETPGQYRYGETELAAALAAATGKVGLGARIDAELELGGDGSLEATISLVNSSPEEHPDFRDTRLYECALAITDLATRPFLLESLEDSFRYDRRVRAYGINCGVRISEGWLTTEDAITVDRPRPNYWNVEDEIPDLRFETLAEDPLLTGKALLAALTRWGAANWSSATLERRATDEAWSSDMAAQAKEASNEFDRERGRIEDGLDLLASNPELNAAFKGMNRAMVQASGGRYNAWRPFQYGFLLANLRCIVDSLEEAEVADLVWFSTGGGKTETYLGLLLTAALYDRLTGKTAGITAWSRFPLRMLSLQQTQRFADAIAAAEVVREQMDLPGDVLSLGFFVGQGATPNRIPEDAKPGDPDPDDIQMPSRYQVLEYCPFCHERSILMAFDRRLWRLEHRCTNSECSWFEKALPIYIVDEEIYRFLPTIVVGTLDKAASIAIQASMRGFVGNPIGMCSRPGHGYTYSPRSARPTGCLVPGCRDTVTGLPMKPHRYAPSFRLQDELHLLRDSLGAVDSHYEALYDGLQTELSGRRPKILASSATLAGYDKQVRVLYRRSARVFPVPPPRAGAGFWAGDSEQLMRRFVAIAPRGVTIEYTVDRLLTELQVAIRKLVVDPVSACAEIGVDPSCASDLVSLYGTQVVYGNTLRDLEAVTRSMETQVLVSGSFNTASLTGKTDFSEVRQILDRLQQPEQDFNERLHLISASSMMSHGVDVDRLNVMVMLGIPLSAAEFLQATARVGRRYPGLVFVVHKIGRERDAGIFRSFRQFVEQGDRFVEPIPITRRSRRVLDRTVSGFELARLLMIHEASSGSALTTVRTFKQYVDSGKFNLDEELQAIAAALGLEDELDEPLRRDLAEWFAELRRNIDMPPGDARFPSDLSPSGPPMLSLRDVERQVPIIGNRV